MLSSRQVERFNRRRLILSAYDKAGEPLTDRQVVDIIGYRDMNSARPRITELVEEGILKEVGTVEDHLTKRTVRLTAKSVNYRQLEMSL
jgi:hypothetical protein